MLTKLQENMVNRIKEHDYKCDVSSEGVIIYLKHVDGTIIDHNTKGEHLSRSLQAMLDGVSWSHLMTANTATRNALIHIEDFVKDHTQYEENTDLRHALNCLASVLAMTESNLRDKEAMTYIEEVEKKDD